MGVFDSREAADKYVQSHETEEGEQYLIDEVLVQS